VRSLFSRLLASYVILVVATLLLLGGALGIFFTQYEIGRRTAELTARGRRIAALVLEEDLFAAAGERRRPFGTVLSAMDEMMNARILLIDRTGLIRMSTMPQNPARARLLEPDEAERLNAGGVVVRHGDLPPFGPGVSVAVPIIDDEGGTPTVAGAVFLFSPLRGFWTNLQEARTMTIYAGLLAIGLATAMGYTFSLHLSRPIKQMTASVQAMRAGDFRVRVDETPPGEIGELAQGFNSLAAQLGETIEALQRERRKVEAILHGMGEGVIAVDGDGRIIVVNPAFERMLGVEAAALLQRRAARVPVPEALRSHLAQPDALPEEPLQFTVEAGGSTFLLTVAPLRQEPGVSLGAVGVLRDITEQEKLERMRRDFLANVSHDLRTPLTTMRGFLQAIAEGVVTDPAATRQSAEAMLRETMRLIRLVNTLVELSRLQSGAVRLQRRPVRLQPLIEDLLAPFLVAAEEKGIRLHADVPGHLPPVPVDPNRFEQVLCNLLENAIKFVEPGDTVSLRARLDAEGKGIVIEVADDGPGIAPEELPHIWERFYKGDKSRAQHENSGAGLGLVIVKDVVEAHGGRVWARSDGDGRGAVFGTWFPLDPPAQGEPGREEPDRRETHQGEPGPWEPDRREPDPAESLREQPAVS